jgi:SAM-dependent methyltransferase
MSRDVYSHPPRSARSRPAAVTRRSLLGFPATTVAQQDIDYDAITRRVRAAWERPGADDCLRTLEPVADALVALAGVADGARVLDVGWELADAQSLPFTDGSFDAVLSAFGATLAPRPGRIASELCRVACPGGVVALAAWVPRGLPGALFELAQDLDPLPDGVPTPAEWGRQGVARERLGSLLDDLELRTRTVRLRFADPDAAFDALSPWAAVDPATLPSLRPRFDRALAACNNRLEAVEIDARYLIAIGHRPA